MEENNNNNNNNNNPSSSRVLRRKSTVDDDVMIECSGKYCKSCTAGLIADCVAVCCCPCALLNCLVLAFIKVPWNIGKRCLGREKKNRRRLERKRKCRKNNENNESHQCDGDVVERNGNLEKMRVEEEILEIIRRSSSGFEAEEERVWLEMYQVGHLSFGRVSFTGSQCQGKGN